MSYRFTNTEKWTDAWFFSLKPNEKLLFNFLCDNCDIAGFIEIVIPIWANQIGLKNVQIQGALKGLARGLIYSKDNSCLYIRTFLKHQKNLPLNESNKAHVGIIKRFNIYKNIFDIQDINLFIEGANKGLQSPIGIGIGKDNGEKEEEIEKKQEFDYSIFNQYELELMLKWVDYHKKKKKPLLKESIELYRNEFDKHGFKAMKDAIESSMLSGYQGYKFNLPKKAEFTPKF